MKRICRLVLFLSLLILGTLSEPLTYKAAEAGFGRDEQSCTGNWYWQGGQCVPDDMSTDILVYGTAGWDSDFFHMYIIPLYDTNAASDFSYLPVEDGSSSRGAELNRRKRIHDCVAAALARGMEADVPGLVAYREVTFEYQGVRARFDIVETQSGFPSGVTEVKTVLDYEGASEDLLVRNQPIVAEGIRNGQAIPYGQNASLAGFVVGRPIGRSLPFSVVALPVHEACKNA